MKRWLWVVGATLLGCGGTSSDGGAMSGTDGASQTSSPDAPSSDAASDGTSPDHPVMDALDDSIADMLARADGGTPETSAPDSGSTDVAQDASDPATSLKTDQLASWSFDDDGKDRSGNALDLELGGLSFGTGKFGSGLACGFDATKWARRPQSDPALVLATGDFTVSVWVNIASANASTNQFVVSKGYQNGWWLGWLAPSWVFSFGEAFGVAPGGPASVGSLHNLILERQGGSATLYFDGAPGRAVQVSDLPTPSTQILSVGASAGALPFDGVIDDLAIWSRALTVSERAYLGGHAVPAAHP